MIAERIPQLDSLTPSEKRMLAAELLDEANLQDNLSADPPRELLDALERTVEFNLQSPGKLSTWEEVRARLKRSRDG
jgi:hypothetical protein